MIGHDGLTLEERAYRDECDVFLTEHPEPELVARQRRAFERLRDPNFRRELVGREVEGSPVARRSPEWV